MEQPESPADIVSRISGWLLPNKEETAESPRASPRSSPGGGSIKLRDVSLGFFTSSLSTSPEKGTDGYTARMTDEVNRENREANKKDDRSVGVRGTRETSSLSKLRSVRSEGCDIRAEDVLRFWFGGDMHINYKTKWFPDGSVETQRKADESVFNLFGDLFKSAMNNELEEWKKELRSTVALILVFDQFSRHIFRLHKVPTGDPQRSLADALALSASEELTGRAGWDADLSVHEFVFTLMPFRHTPTTERLSGVLKSVAEREVTESESLDLLLKFRKQTVRRLQHLQDIEKADASDILEQSAFKADESDMPLCAVVTSTELFLRRHITFSKAIKVEDTPFSQYKRGKNQGDKDNKNSKNEIDDTDNSTVSTEPVIFPGAQAHLPMDIIPAKSPYGEGRQPVAISLSGGVDSMVIAAILVHLRDTGRLPLGTITAVHIDYANREESALEADFVRSWCVDMGIDCRVRLVNEVTRGITGRDEYEKVSRDIRYAFYRTVLTETGCTGVIFGHHLGDVQENVISNVMRGSSPLALSGMTEAGVSNGVHVWRPLLSHPKTDILDFAHKYGVPYFKDTTPSWSTRGKLRTLLMPLLIDMYGEGCVRSLSGLAVESDEMKELVGKNVYSPFCSSVSKQPCGLSVDISPYLTQPLCFWREMLKELMHSMGMSMVRERSVKSFLERIQPVPAGYNKSSLSSSSSSASSSSSSSSSLPSSSAPPSLSPSLAPPKSAVGWLELRKGFHTLLTPNGVLVILRDGVITSGRKGVSINKEDIKEGNTGKGDNNGKEDNEDDNKDDSKEDKKRSLSNSSPISNIDESSLGSLESSSGSSGAVSVDDFVHVKNDFSPPIISSISSPVSPPHPTAFSSPFSPSISSPLSPPLSSSLSVTTTTGSTHLSPPLSPDTAATVAAATASNQSTTADIPTVTIDTNNIQITEGVSNNLTGQNTPTTPPTPSTPTTPTSTHTGTPYWLLNTRYLLNDLREGRKQAQLIQLGPWEIIISNIKIQEKEMRHKNRTLQNVQDLLSGQFSYYLKIPLFCSILGVLSDNIIVNGSPSRGQKIQGKDKKNREGEKEGDMKEKDGDMKGNNDSTYDNTNDNNDDKKEGKKDEKEASKDEKEASKDEKKDEEEEVVLETPALNGIDSRLKAGLPLLVPISQKKNLLLDDSEGCILLLLEYSYISKV